jgi:hypothetical protein
MISYQTLRVHIVSPRQTYEVLIACTTEQKSFRLSSASSESRALSAAQLANVYQYLPGTVTQRVLQKKRVPVNKVIDYWHSSMTKEYSKIPFFVTVTTVIEWYTGIPSHCQPKDKPWPIGFTVQQWGQKLICTWHLVSWIKRLCLQLASRRFSVRILVGTSTALRPPL